MNWCPPTNRHKAEQLPKCVVPALAEIGASCRNGAIPRRSGLSLAWNSEVGSDVYRKSGSDVARESNAS